jgi:ABC-type transport system involved in multi-copper enzyme maturation permease subunit
MLALIRYILLTALRDRLLIGMVFGLIIISYLSYVIGNTALVEENQTAIALAAGTMRLSIMLGLIVFSCFHVRHAMLARELEVQLSRPISRPKLLLSYFIGFMLVSLALLIPGFILLALMQPLSLMGYAAYCVSLIAEASVILAFAMFCSFLLSSAVMAVLATIGFYLLARLMGFFITTLSNHPAFTDYVTQNIASGSVDIVALITPRLDFFAQSAWLNMGVSPENWALFLGQTIIYAPLLLLATMLDLKRKNF